MRGKELDTKIANSIMTQIMKRFDDEPYGFPLNELSDIDGINGASLLLAKHVMFRPKYPDAYIWNSCSEEAVYAFGKLDGNGTIKFVPVNNMIEFLILYGNGTIPYGYSVLDQPQGKGQLWWPCYIKKGPMYAERRTDLPLVPEQRTTPVKLN